MNGWWAGCHSGIQLQPAVVLLWFSSQGLLFLDRDRFGPLGELAESIWLDFLIEQAECYGDTVEDGFGMWWTTLNVVINRQQRIHAADDAA